MVQGGGVREWYVCECVCECVCVCVCVCVYACVNVWYNGPVVWAEQGHGQDRGKAEEGAPVSPVDGIYERVCR